MSPKAISLIAISIIVLGSVAGFVYVQSSVPLKKSESYPISMKDDLGRNITIKVRPNRIISLVPSASEIIYAAGAGHLLVGVDQFSAFPDDLVARVKSGNLTVVGSGFTPDLDRIISLAPDIIFVNGPSQFESKGVQRLSDLGYTIVSLNAQNISGVLQNIDLVGGITGNSESAAKAVSGFRERVTKIENAVKNAPKVRVYVENWHDPLFSVGAGSLQDELVVHAGGINIFSDMQKKSGEVSPEAVVAKNPQVIILFDRGVTVEQVKSRPGWNIIDAVKNNRVYYISDEQNTGAYGAPGPRIVDGLEKMAMLIHSDLSKNLENENANGLLMLLLEN